MKATWENLAKSGASGCILDMALGGAGNIAKAAKYADEAGDASRAGKSGRGGKPTCNSFTPGTDVLMANGTTKNIEDIQLGDLVWATAPPKPANPGHAKSPHSSPAPAPAPAPKSSSTSPSKAAAPSPPPTNTPSGSTQKAHGSTPKTSKRATTS
ncbi:MAG: hypothetical protein U5R31_16810 [Acidimicrobiia bacterium]|nr:hypothetical protein [Acidimicrobiia bacterium]